MVKEALVVALVLLVVLATGVWIGFRLAAYGEGMPHRQAEVRP